MHPRKISNDAIKIIKSYKNSNINFSFHLFIVTKKLHIFIAEPRSSINIRCLVLKSL